MLDDAMKGQRLEDGGQIGDAELLRRYAAEKSEEAFAGLVRRHLDLVYSAALRQTGGDGHRAQDVAQIVFTTLARKAGALTRHPMLAGWLYTATQHAAAKTMRTEWRRRAREQEAHRMQEILSSEESSTDWDRVRPVLDEAMRDLNERDREAVLLRFFARQPFAGIGTALNLSEDAARMRVERALEKLHGLLARRGVTSTSAALAVVLANQGTLAAPAGLALSVTGTALAAGAGGGATATFLTFMGINKTSVGVLAAITGVLTLDLVQQRANARLQDELASVMRENRGFEPLRAENRRLTREVEALAGSNPDAAELARLRMRAGELKAQLAARLTRSGGGSPVITESTTPEEKMELIWPGGLSSPMRAWQTMMASGLRGDLDVHALTFCVDAPGRAKLAAFLAGLPDLARAEFRSPERLVAPVFTQWLWKGDRPAGYSPSRDVPVEGDLTRAHAYVRITYASGQKREDRFPYQRFDDGWRYGPLTSSDVGELLSLLDPATGQPKSRQK